VMPEDCIPSSSTGERRRRRNWAGRGALGTARSSASPSIVRYRHPVQRRRATSCRLLPGHDPRARCGPGNQIGT
jgi:hypothetical protein